MEIRQLRYFVAVAETRHFSRAAESLHLAQPALSQSVRQLEAELGVTLLARTTRQVDLTPAGEFLHREARRILQSLDDTVRGVRRIAEGRLGLVRIGFTGTAAFDQLPPIAHVVKEQLPGIALEIHADLLTPAQVSRLRSAQLDLAVLRPPVNGDDLIVRTINREPLILALPADHRLADRPGLTIQDVRDEDFVMYADTHSAVNEAVLRSCRSAGFAPRREHEAPGTSALLALVGAGLGVAMVPASARALRLDGVVYSDLAGTASIDLALAWPRNHPPLVATLVDALETSGFFGSQLGLPATADSLLELEDVG